MVPQPQQQERHMNNPAHFLHMVVQFFTAPAPNPRADILEGLDKDVTRLIFEVCLATSEACQLTKRGKSSTLQRATGTEPRFQIGIVGRGRIRGARAASPHPEAGTQEPEAQSLTTGDQGNNTPSPPGSSAMRLRMRPLL